MTTKPEEKEKKPKTESNTALTSPLGVTDEEQTEDAESIGHVLASGYLSF